MKTERNTSCLLSPAPPQVYLKIKKAKVSSNYILSCMATGFSSKHTILQIKENDRILTRQDGVQTTGARPNEDDTYQRIESVETVWRDGDNYTCEVIHAPSKLHITQAWGKNRLSELPDGTRKAPPS